MSAPPGGDEPVDRPDGREQDPVDPAAPAPVPRPRRADTGASPRGRRRARGDRGSGDRPAADPPTADRSAAAEEGEGRSGRRRSQSRARRRRARTRTGVVVAGLTVVAIAVVVGAFNLVDRARDLVGGEPEVSTPDAAPGDPQPVVTVVSTVEGADGPEAVAIALLAVERETGEGTILLVPPATIADVPGHGAFRLSEAFEFGGAALLGVSLDNLLGARSDAVVTVDEDGWASLLDRLGTAEVSLAEPVIDRAEDGSGTTLLPAGDQVLAGPQLATLLTHRSADESQLDHLARVRTALVAVLDRAREEPAALDAAFADGAPEVEVATTAADADTDTAAGAELLHTVLAELAAARADDAVTSLTLFVSPLGTGNEDAYRPDVDRIASLVDDRLAASRPDPGVSGGRTLQLLNGNGQPGVGAEIAELLQPAGYRVLLTGNADRFTYEVTRIVVYDEEPATLAAARDVRDRLGVGQIERSGTPQSVVDLTIVVGHDFPVDGTVTGDPDGGGDAADPGGGEADAPGDGGDG